MKNPIQYFVRTGWLIPAGVALVFFARWIREIVVRTLKGCNFEALYDIRVKYLDTTLICTAVEFAWAGMEVLRWAKSSVNDVLGLGKAGAAYS